MATIGRPPSCLCGRCPKCRRRQAARRRYRNLSLQERRAIVARRDVEKVRAADRARDERDAPRRRAAAKRYHREHPATVARAQRRWRQRNAEKVRAHSAVARALRSGRLTREACEVCGTTENVHAHHDDYSRPLEVRWLCAADHAADHKAARRAVA